MWWPIPASPQGPCRGFWGGRWRTGVKVATSTAGPGVAAIAFAGLGLQVGLLIPLVILFQANGAAAAFLVTMAAANAVATAFALEVLRPAIETDRTAFGRLGSRVTRAVHELVSQG